MKHIFALSVAMLPLLGFAAGQGAHTLDIRADRMGAEIQPTMYGLFLKISTMAPTAAFMPRWSRTALSSFRRVLWAGRVSERWTSRTRAVLSTATLTMCRFPVPVTAASTQVLRMKAFSDMPLRPAKNIA